MLGQDFSMYVFYLSDFMLLYLITGNDINTVGNLIFLKDFPYIKINYFLNQGLKSNLSKVLEIP